MKKLLFSLAAIAAAFSMSANVDYKIQCAGHPDDVKECDTNHLRDRFCMEKVMEENKINLTYSMYDRVIFGGVVP